MRNKNLWFIIGAVVIIAAIIVGVRLTQKPAPREQVIKIGAILPLTGSASTAGEFQKNGIEVAVSEINEAGGIDGKKLEIVYGDSKNEAKEGLSVFRQISDVQKIPIVIATHSGVVVPLANQISSKKNVFLFVTISSAPGVTKLSPYIFRYFVTSENESRKMASFAYRNLKLKRVGVFYINDEFGVGGSTTFKELFEKLGGKVVWEESYDKAGTDFRSSLIKAATSREVEALYIIGYDRAFAIAVKQAREVGYKGTILTSIGMSIPEWIKVAGQSAEGIYVTATRFEPGNPMPEIQEFVQRYRKRFGKDPNMMSAFTYDSIKMIAQAIKKNGYSVDGVAKGLRELDFHGVIGNVKFDEAREGHVELVIRKISQGKAQFYSE